MKKIVLGIVAALGIATPAMAETLAPSALESYLLNEFSDKFTLTGSQFTYRDTIDGISVSMGGVIGSSAVGMTCATGSSEIGALSAADHAHHLNNVSAADWWYDKGDAVDSLVYWRTRILEKASASTSGVAGVVAVMEATGDDFLRQRAASACYSEQIGYNGDGIKDYVTVSVLGVEAPYNEHVRRLIEEGTN